MRFRLQAQYPPDTKWVEIGEYDTRQKATEAMWFVKGVPGTENYRVVDTEEECLR